jgi:hypothetical protein
MKPSFVQNYGKSKLSTVIVLPRMFAQKAGWQVNSLPKKDNFF